jgi:uncharacterized membrane protein
MPNEENIVVTSRRRRPIIGESHSQLSSAMRTVHKTASYALMHLIVAVSVAYALTRDWRAALAIGLVEPIFQTAAFALHERAWARAAAPLAPTTG